MEPEGSLPQRQEPATCHYPEPDQSSPCPPSPTSWNNNNNMLRTRDSSVGVVPRLRAGRSGIWIAGAKMTFTHLRNVQTGPGDRLSCCWMHNRYHFRWLKLSGREADHSPHRERILRMSGVILLTSPPPPRRVCLHGVNRDTFTSPFWWCWCSVYSTYFNCNATFSRL